PGKLADLVVLTANPLDDITHTDDIAQVMLGGRLYDAMTLEQIAPTRVPGPVMPWQRAARELGR
ncbi:MAG: hypothetical protein KY466_14670, partial [Gemmatimonadetes bacterium]|nr:hypothetical protein [Gemmatimonadota bacterium]